jgi:hypothetical protein
MPVELPCVLGKIGSGNNGGDELPDTTPVGRRKGGSKAMRGIVLGSCLTALGTLAYIIVGVALASIG